MEPVHSVRLAGVYHFLEIFCVTSAVVSFSINDMGVKCLSGGHTLHQIALIGSIVTLLFNLAVFIRFDSGGLVVVARH